MRFDYLLLAMMLLLPCNHLSALVVDFDDLILGAESEWHGPDPAGQIVEGPYGDEVHGQFLSRGSAFVNRFDLINESWTGFAYSNQSDTETPGYVNQFSAITGTGLGEGSDNYGVGYGYLDLTPNLFQPFAFDPTNPEHLNKLPFFDVPSGGRAESLYVTNTTYAVKSMETGDQFAKKFGGETGTDPDWFKLSIYGTDAMGNPPASSVEFYLADFRGEVDTIVTTWTLLELNGLEDARRLHFNLSSSDVGIYGLNTPAYFAIDNISIVASGLTGDFDADGDVDGRDFLLWQRQFGTAQDPFTGADGDGDGLVTAADLALWQKNYARAAESSSRLAGSTLLIPEPSFCCFALSALACCFFARPARAGRAFFTLTWRCSS